MNTSPEYMARWKQLCNTRAWPKSALMSQCGRLGIYGTSGGLNGLGGWTRDELVDAILRSEFPPATVTGNCGG